jgi:hypothetical protein
MVPKFAAGEFIVFEIERGTKLDALLFLDRQSSPSKQHVLLLNCYFLIRYAVLQALGTLCPRMTIQWYPLYERHPASASD